MRRAVRDEPSTRCVKPALGHEMARHDRHPVLGARGRVRQHEVAVALQVDHAHVAVRNVARVVARDVLVLVLAVVADRLREGQQQLARAALERRGAPAHEREDAVGEPARDGHAPAAGPREGLDGVMAGALEQGVAVVVVEEAVMDEDAALGAGLCVWICVAGVVGWCVRSKACVGLAHDTP